ncbi:hypothetical protein FJD35_20455 [Pseudomonas mandelii]|nr:hypothetical protein FJD35_20455 [Pseudomonas mandelii]
MSADSLQAEAGIACALEPRQKKSRTPSAPLHPMCKSTEVHAMNSDDSDIERDRKDKDAEELDSETHPEEDEAEALQRKIDEIERKVADGN